MSNICREHKDFKGDVCPVCLKNENDFSKSELRQTQARLNHADEEIERLNKLSEKLRDIAKSFKEQTRKALAEQYKLSVRVTELENELKAKVI